MRKVPTTFIAVSMLFTIYLFIIGCDDDNNGTQPTPSPTVSPSPSPSPSPGASPTPSPTPPPAPTPTPTPTPSNLGSDISQACAGEFAGFIGGIGRGTACLCEGEFRGEFLLELGPNPEEGPLIIKMGGAALLDAEGRRTTFGVEEKDASTFSLFNVEPDPDVPGGLTLVGDPVGELQNLIEGFSSFEFVIQLGDDTPERVVCPACASGPIPPEPECDLEEELDKPKCLDTQTLVATGSSCPADSIVRVCDPFLCGAQVVDEETGQSIVFDFGSLPSENSVALGCNTIRDGSLIYTNIENIPPSGTFIVIGTGEGTFGCSEREPTPTPTPTP